MTDLDVCSDAIANCGNTPEDIEACLDILRPIIEPYFEEGGFDKRFGNSFKAMMKMPIQGKLLRAKEIVKNLLDGPTHAEEQERVKAEREKQEAEVRKQFEEGEKQFISALLAKIGFRKGDQIPVRWMADDGSTGGTRLIPLEKWDLPEAETQPDSPKDLIEVDKDDRD